MTEFYELFKSTKYISIQERKEIEDLYLPLYKKTKRNIFYIFTKQKRCFVRDYQNIKNIVDTSNEQYLTTSINNNRILLSNVNGYSLDCEQSRAVLSEEKNTLIIAGAGSGKTLTIVGKIRYLIEHKLVEEKDILCISFTNATTQSLKHNLKNEYDYDVDVFTFHKLALNILSRHNFNITESDTLDYIINEFYDYIIFEYPTAMKIVLEYFDIFSSNYISKYENLKTRKSFLSFKRLLSQFIHLFKANVYNDNNLYKYLKKATGKDYCFLRCVIIIYNIYRSELDSGREIDFDDMIIKATEEVKNYGCKKYKHIIIDEYQDTSLVRNKLIEAIINYSGSTLTVVGDDFQSIYKFTGSNLDVFLDFENIFPNSKTLYLNNTYRNSQELISIAGSFIMKNKKQMKKKLKSNITNLKPIKIIYYDDLKNTFKKIITLFKNSNSPVLVLGRNNNDIFKAIDTDYVYNNSTVYLNDFSFTYLTVHRSKGLEEENVIIINLEDSITGFPNKIEESDVLKYIIPLNEVIPYEEERRLFYVAITRTKNYNYLLVPRKKQSLFVRELLRDYKGYIEILNLD